MDRNWANLIKNRCSVLAVLASCLALSSCNMFFKSSDSATYGESQSSQNAQQSGLFSFTTAGNYTYDTNYISVTAGRATLLTVDQTHNTASDFTSGTHLGTAFSSGALVPASGGGCDGSATNCFELDSSWTPQFASLIGYYKLNNNGNDSSPSGNNGTVTGATFTTSAKVGSHALSFDGTSDYVQMANSAALSPEAGDHTVAMWFKTNTNFTINTFLYSNYGAAASASVILYFDPADNLICRYRNSTNDAATASSTQRFNGGVWYHAACVRSGNNVFLYVDGVRIDSGSNASLGTVSVNSTYLPTIGGYGVNVNTSEYTGEIDEAAFWNVALSRSELLRIYNRQKAKFAGRYSSRIIDLGTSGTWTTLDWITSLPFGKDLPGNSGNEQLAHYSGLVTSTGVSGASNLNTDLVGLWHFNETAANGGGDDFADSSSGANGGEAFNSAASSFGEDGILGKSFYFDGVDDYITITGVGLGTISNFTTCFWFKNFRSSSANDSNAPILTFGASRFTFVFTNVIKALIANDTAWHWSSDSPVYTDWDKWHHYCARIDGTSLQYYRDGVRVVNNTSETGSVAFGTPTIYVGANSGNSLNQRGHLDELAIWRRALHPNEIIELYRRGANRVNFQVRSCNDAACSGETWFGSNGTINKFFTEAQNCTSINGANGDCTGNVNTVAPSLTFSDFTTAPAANRYFQYELVVESDDENDLCAGSTPCLPSVSSIEIGPTGRYYAGSATIQNNNTVSFISISSLVETAGGTCTVTYQISNDGATFYYYNGANWVVAAGAGQTNNGTVINTNLGSFATDVAGGNLFFRAYLNSDTTQTCELDELNFSYE